MPAALITGASSGIGAEFARQLAARGFDLILVARRRDRLEQLARELVGVHVEVLTSDLTVDAELGVVERRLKAEDIDLLVNNAGFGTLGKFFEADLEGQDRMHRLHVLATMRLTHAALPGMVARGKGGVINVSSVAAFGSTPGSVSYCATKTWMNRFTESLALELRSVGSKVNMQALCPGFTYTEFHEVIGMDRKTIPAGWWTRAGKVVEASLRGLDRGKVIVIPGLRYQLLARVMQLVPAFLMRSAVTFYARKTKRV